MNKPLDAAGVCEICQKEFILNNPIPVLLKYEMECYVDTIEGAGAWLDYEVCSDCFSDKILPALHQVGLPKREWHDYIS